MDVNSNESAANNSSLTVSKHHDSARFYSTKTFRLLSMLSLTTSFFFIELVVGNITKSLALVADAFHMLSDLIALIIALIVVRVAKRRSDINTFGWVRAEVVGANINTVFLLTLCLTIIFDTIKRYIDPEPIENPTLLLIVGSVGLGINIIGLFLFQGFHSHSHGGDSNDQDGEHGHTHDAVVKSNLSKESKKSLEMNTNMTKSNTNNITTSESNENIEPLEVIIVPSNFKRHSLRALDEVIVDCTSQAHDTSPSLPTSNDSSRNNKKNAKKSSMNMHGVFLHVLADALGSVVVIISSLIIKFVPHNPDDRKHWTVYVDPTLSVIIVIIITVSAIPLLKETTYVLLQTVPKNFQISSLKKQLLENVSEIDGIHDLHVWRLTSNVIVATAHLQRRSFTDYMTVANKVKRFFHKHGIHSTTIQYEYFDDERRDSLAQENNGNNESKADEMDCLLRCPDEICETKTCCTNDSIRNEGMLNSTNKNNVQKVLTDAVGVSIDMRDEQMHNRTTTDDAGNGMVNKGYVVEKF